MVLVVERFSQQLVSIRPEHARTPLVPNTRRWTVEDARDFLLQFKGNEWSLQRALRTELGRVEGLPVRGTLLEDVARQIAMRKIWIASSLRANPKLVFDDKQPYGGPFGVVNFSDASVATTFADWVQGNEKAAAAVRGALAHEAGSSWCRDLSPHAASGAAFSRPILTRRRLDEPEMGWCAAQTAILLANGWLMLLPLGLRENLFRLVWRRVLARSATADDLAVDELEPIDRPRRKQGSRPRDYHWIEIELLDNNGKPVAGEIYSVTLPAGKIITGTLNSDGWARVDYPGSAGNCQVSFPKLDKAEWQQHSASPLGPRDGR